MCCCLPDSWSKLIKNCIMSNRASSPKLPRCVCVSKCLCPFVWVNALMLIYAQTMPVSLPFTLCPAKICFICVPHCFTLFPPFMRISAVCCLTLFSLLSPLWLCTCVFLRACDELAGNRLLNGASAAMWDKIETGETERLIHLLYANHPCKNNWPFH